MIRPDGTRLGELRPWMTAELAKENGDVDALWRRLKETDLQITEWRGTSAFVFAPTGPGAADYVQIALGREIEWRAGPIVNPDYRPFGEEELLDPSWPRRDRARRGRIAWPGPVYRLLGPRRRRARPSPQFSRIAAAASSASKREAKRPELERRVIQRDRTGRNARDAVPRRRPGLVRPRAARAALL